MTGAVRGRWHGALTAAAVIGQWGIPRRNMTFILHLAAGSCSAAAVSLR